MNTKQFYEWLGRPRQMVNLLNPIITPEVGAECLTSFLLRNQIGLGINASQLLEYSAMILENVEQKLVKAHLFSANILPLSLNGDSERTQTLCEALSSLQPGTDFEQLTLKAYEVQTNGLLLQPKLKKKIHWCVQCFKEWQESGLDIHYPLVWLLQGSHACKIHSKPLSNVCMHCGTQHKHLNHKLMNGACSRCKGLLMTTNNQCVVGQAELF